MKAFTIPSSNLDAEQLRRQLDQNLTLVSHPTWTLIYAVQDFPVGMLMDALAMTHGGLPTFGATSFRGVFTAAGFTRGAALLVGEADDRVRAQVALERTGPREARSRAKEACRTLRRQLDRNPTALLLHATPGFEERLLEGIEDAFGGSVPVYGGSAADDTIEGNWKVFANGEEAGEGFVLAAFASRQPIRGAFMSGYLPTEHSGIVTRVDGRTVLEINRRPAAAVYNEWTQGAISEELEGGGNILLKTNLYPVGRVVGESLGMPTRLLSHPCEVVGKNQALKFFSEFEGGDQITLMTATKGSLVKRTGKAVGRALGGDRSRLQGGLFVYCGGCVGMLLDQADTIAQDFGTEVGTMPFVGVATFGEQGCLTGKRNINRHGNLMCSTMLFG